MSSMALQTILITALNLLVKGGGAIAIWKATQATVSKFVEEDRDPTNEEIEAEFASFDDIFDKIERA